MKRFLSWLVIACMAISLCAVASAEGEQAAVLDFEDGVFAFAGLDAVKGNADASELSVAEFNGSNALKVVPQGKVPYVALNLEGLLGENLSKVRSISFDVGVDNAEDGKFYAVSGSVYFYAGEDNAESKADWSVYLAKKNPKTAVAALADGVAFIEGAGNYAVISREVDNAATAGLAPVALYLDNIKFLDEAGEALPVDNTAVFVAADSGKDLSNLSALANAVEFPGFSVSGDAWAQNGLEMPQEILDALVPGSVVEIEYKSEDGSMWIVMPDAAVGWSRVADNGGASLNNSHSIAQVTYEQIEAICGEDKSAWGARMQCEASSAWEVYAVRVGTAVNQIVLGGAVEFPGFSVSGDAWGQNGLEMPEEIVNALVPGSVIEIDFESEDGSMWIVMPDAAAGWSRVADNGGATIIDGKAYVTYEQIEAVCGEDKTAWGARMQCEASSAWQVYAVKVGTRGEMKALSGLVSLPGFDVSGDAWGQNGVDMTEEFLAALVPGSVITINFESEDGSMWIVLPDAAAGWSRVADNGGAAISGGIAQVTYDQIVAVCGEDVSAWGGRLQCESSSAWHVYSVAVGNAR